jgi:hypothetical protein
MSAPPRARGEKAGGKAPRKRERRARLALLLSSILVTLIGVEVGSRALFRWPGLWIGRAPARVEAQLRRFHRGFLQGAPIQFRPDCSEPDSELLYRLRPGRCRFATDEFDSEVRVSGRHLREDRVVGSPDLVFLGDSYTLGWGVEREASFPAIVSRGLWMQEVVAANSSYGTVRELLLLRRLDLSDFGTVILQYCTNDIEENREFIRSRGYVPSPPEVYGKWVAVAGRIDRKRMLAHARHWFSFLWSDLWSAAVGTERTEATVVTPEEHAEALLEVLDAFRSDLRGRPVLVFAADMGPGEVSFVRAINEGVTSTRLPTVKALPATLDVIPEDLFRLDRHWRPRGHEAVAAALAASGLLRPGP